MKEKLYAQEYNMDLSCSFSTQERSITATGRWDPWAEQYSVNTSGILTRLIHEAGRFCLHYASDLFIIWKSVEKYLSVCGHENRQAAFVFGFRESGVDPASFVVENFRNGTGYVYRSLYVLVANEDSSGGICLALRKADKVERVEVAA